MTPDTKRVVIIGAGPAGLTAAYQLSKVSIPSIVLEKDLVVGGLSRTVDHHGYHFDIGGHRFFTKIPAVQALWNEVLDESNFPQCQRLSRILYRKHFFNYPLTPSNALRGLGLINGLLIVSSYLKAQLFPQRPEETLEDWVTNRFGQRLYRIFFKTYTEKVWGIPCDQITAEWAAQRIKGLSLMTAVKNALLKSQPDSSQPIIKTLVDAFHYPRKGPGMMWQKVSQMVRDAGHEVRLNSGVEKIIWKPEGVTAVTVQGVSQPVSGTHFISTMPIRELIGQLDPDPPEAVLKAARQLHYRDFLTVALIIDQKDVFADNWIYIHDPAVQVGRIQNFKNWSPAMVPDPEKTCLGLEYFCFQGDGLWSRGDADLIELATGELRQLGLLKAEARVEDGAVVRMPKAYPVYDATYRKALLQIRQFLDTLPNLFLVGRNGMHKYNNQDHSMFTAMLAVENILGAQHELWKVNSDDEYHEEIQPESASEEQLRLLRSTQPRVPSRLEDARAGLGGEKDPVEII